MKVEEIYTYICLIIIGYLVFKLFNKKCEYFTIGGPCVEGNDDCKAGIYCAPGGDLIDCCDGLNLIDADISRCSNTDTICLQQAAKADIICADANNDCNIHEDCNDNATSVEGNKGNCDCRCNLGYVGTDCSVPDPQPQPPQPPQPPPPPPSQSSCLQYVQNTTNICNRLESIDDPTLLPSSDCCIAVNDGLTNYQNCRIPNLNSLLREMSQHCDIPEPPAPDPEPPPPPAHDDQQSNGYCRNISEYDDYDCSIHHTIEDCDNDDNYGDYGDNFDYDLSISRARSRDRSCVWVTNTSEFCTGGIKTNADEECSNLQSDQCDYGCYWVFDEDPSLLPGYGHCGGLDYRNDYYCRSLNEIECRSYIGKDTCKWDRGL